MPLYKYMQVRLSPEEDQTIAALADWDRERGGPGTKANVFRSLIRRATNELKGVKKNGKK